MPTPTNPVGATDGMVSGPIDDSRIRNEKTDPDCFKQKAGTQRDTSRYAPGRGVGPEEAGNSNLRITQYEVPQKRADQDSARPRGSPHPGPGRVPDGRTTRGSKPGSIAPGAQHQPASRRRLEPLASSDDEGPGVKQNGPTGDDQQLQKRVSE